MNPESWLQTGVGGAIALVMFHFYRQDRKLTESTLLASFKQFTQIIEENTRAMTALTEVVRALSDRENKHNPNDQYKRHG